MPVNVKVTLGSGDPTHAGPPPEIVAVNGPVIYEKMRKRRDALMEDGMKYYALISKEPVIYATDEDDVAQIRMEGDKLQVQLREADAKSPYYSRSFDAKKTKKISLHLFDGGDEFVADKNISSPITIFLDSGKGKDKYNYGSNLSLKTDKDTQKKLSANKQPAEN